MSYFKQIKIKDNDGNIAKIDEMTQTLVNTDESDNAIHEGNSYVAFIADDAMGNNDTIEMLIITPDTTVWPHITLRVIASGDGILKAYIDPVTTSDGTPVTAANRNSNSSNTATTDIYHTPTVTSDGTEIFVAYFGAGLTGTGGAAKSANDFILQQNTKYLVRFTSEDNNNRAKVSLDWEEVDSA